MDAHISVQNLHVWYGTHAALSAISVNIPRHGITVIMGPSGCGKTTLLKSFNRFLELNDTTRISGTVAVDGQDVYAPGVDVTAVRKRVGLLAQRPTALPMSIFENVAYGIRIHQPQLNKSALEDVVYAPTGFFMGYQAWRKNVTGVVKGPLPFFWNVAKA